MAEKSIRQWIFEGLKHDRIRRALQYVGELPSMSEYIPQPSLQERDRRWKRIREEMIKRSLDCLLVWGSDSYVFLSSADFRYVTAIPPQGNSLAVFPLKRDPIVYMANDHEAYYYGLCYAWINDVRPAASANDIITIIKELGLEKGKIGVVDSPRRPVVPYSLWKDVTKELSSVNFVDISDTLELLRLIKSPEEVRLMEESARIATLAYKAVINTAKPGVRECEVYANIKQATYSNGGEPSMLLIGSTFPNFSHPRAPTISTRKLEKGDVILLEYHTSYAGYMAHVERSLSIGKPRKEYLELFKVCKDVYMNMVEKLKPGESFEEIEKAAQNQVLEAGMEWYECMIGPHGLESGSLPLGTILKENMCLRVGHNLYNPRWANGGGLNLASTILVSKEGPRKLENIPVELTVV
jgi:Xaa-Pro aminopeptidase